MARAAGREIIELVSRGCFQEALLAVYEHLRAAGSLETFFLPSVLKACTSTRQSFPFALQLHATTLKLGHLSDTAVANSLLSVYDKHSHVQSARQLFDAMPVRDQVTWNSMINCYVRNGRFSESIHLFKQMRRLGLVPKPEVTAMVLSVCDQTDAGGGDHVSRGRQIHAQSICLGCSDTSVHLSSALIDLYSRCGDYYSSSRIFSRALEKNVVSWTAMIGANVMNGKPQESLVLFREMMALGGEIRPNRATLVAVLPACGDLGSLKQGKEIHAYIFRHGFESEPLVSAALIDMFGRCKGALRLALSVFRQTAAGDRDVAMWSTIIHNCAQSGDSVGAMEFFHRMRVECAKPNFVTMLAVIGACTSLSSGDLGQAAHTFILKSGLLTDISVGNALIDMYMKCGYLNSSVQAFKEMPCRDLVTWSSLISGYGLHGRGSDALRLFEEMGKEGIEPDGITLLVILSACNHSGLVEDGKQVFNEAVRSHGALVSVEHYACYVDLLGRSGLIEEACEVIRGMPMKPSVKIFTSLISACKKYHGTVGPALQLAHQLIDLEPGNAANHALLSMVYAESGDWVGVEEVRKVMNERGVKKNSACSWVEAESGTQSSSLM